MDEGQVLKRTMAEMTKKAFFTVKGAYPVGCLAWLQGNDPGRIGELKATTEAAQRAYLAGDPVALKKALALYRDEHLKTYVGYLDAITGGEG